MKFVSKVVLALITVSMITGTVIALEMFSQFKISYVIQPATETPTLTPNPVTLDLGNIPSGSIGEKDFGNTATISLPFKYEVTFELDDLNDFEEFTVWIHIYEAGTTTYVGVVYLFRPSYVGYTDTETLDAGDYDLHVEIDYTAKPVTTETSGEVTINVSWPG